MVQELYTREISMVKCGVHCLLKISVAIPTRSSVVRERIRFFLSVIGCRARESYIARGPKSQPPKRIAADIP